MILRNGYNGIKYNINNGLFPDLRVPLKYRKTIHIIHLIRIMIITIVIVIAIVIVFRLISIIRVWGLIR